MTPDLFPSTIRVGQAVISSCGRYRYSLSRRVGDADTRCAFVMLNPSTADATTDDPTIRRCMAFARDLGHGWLDVVNLFAYRTTHPKILWSQGARGTDIIGPENDWHINSVAEGAAIVIGGWGAAVDAKPRAREVAAHLATVMQRPVHALGVTKDGQPRHPLYLRGDSRPTLWGPA